MLCQPIDLSSFRLPIFKRCLLRWLLRHTHSLKILLLIFHLHCGIYLFLLLFLLFHSFLNILFCFLSDLFNSFHFVFFIWLLLLLRLCFNFFIIFVFKSYTINCRLMANESKGYRAAFTQVVDDTLLVLAVHR